MSKTSGILAVVLLSSTAMPALEAQDIEFQARRLDYNLLTLTVRLDEVTLRVPEPRDAPPFATAAAMAALPDARHVEQERARNLEVRTFTEDALKAMGCTFAASQTNFLFVDVRRPAKEFREACAKSGVMVGRDFPPFEKTHVRISIGTMDEMRKAVDVFRTVLRTTTT